MENEEGDDILERSRRFPSECPSHRIPESDLKSYLQDPNNIETVVKEFKSIGLGIYTFREEARNPGHMQKNRYDVFLPYDHNRVVLETLEGDPDSHYINASHVDGYSCPRKYIAAAGPVKESLLDFWRLIWQENVRKIAMTTDLQEKQLVKCHKYWPEESEKYGEVTVRLTDTKNFPSFIIRTFQVMKGEESRILEQFYIPDWPDKSVPDSYEAVAEFVKAFRANKASDDEPSLVHCSAGVGRTGTMILLDTCMDMAEAEREVDVLAHLWRLRKQRHGACSFKDQYLLVHKTLAYLLSKQISPI